MDRQAERSVETLVDRGLAAIEADNLSVADRALHEARKSGGENHVRVLHLSGMLAWAREDIDRALGFLLQAVDLAPTDPIIHLDCAECMLFAGEELGQAARTVTAALGLGRLTPRQEDEARLLLAQIRLEEDNHAAAMAALAEIRVDLHEHPSFLCTKASVFFGHG